MSTKNPQPPKLAIVTPPVGPSLVDVRDGIDEVMAIILVACAAINEMDGPDCDSLALVLNNCAYRPLVKINERLAAVDGVNHK